MRLVPISTPWRVALRRIGLPIAALMLLGGCQGKAAAPKADGEQNSQAVSNPAPSFEGQTTRGDDIALADYRGKVVLLNVWATWCGPCRKELPELQKLHHAHGDDFAVVGISIDKAHALRKVQGMMAQYSIDYPVIFDPDGLSIGAFTVKGYPTTILIGRDGGMRWRRDGIIQPNDSALDAEIKAALAAG